MGLSITYDTESKSAVFFDWQLYALEAIPNRDQEPRGSKEIWDCVLANDVKISRASVINFLKALHGFDFIVGVEGTGKGGKRLNYAFSLDREHFNNQVSSTLLGAIVNEYPDVDHFKMLRLLYETRDH